MLIKYDERGSGLSDWDVEDCRVRAPRWVEDLEAVIDATSPGPVPVLGISQGGAVAVSYAVPHIRNG